ncbi:MAG: glutamine synthetase family protein [Gammaproteobacteria bacterium]
MFDILLADINGVWRGLQAPPRDMEKLLGEGFSFPRSLYAMRFDGGLAEKTGLGIAAGDPDYPCVFLHPKPHPALWREGGMQAAAAMQTPEGAPFYADPRQVLAETEAKLQADGFFPLLAAELEFYLWEDNGGGFGNASGAPVSELYSPDALSRRSGFFTLLGRAAEAQNIELGARISEYSAEQFEINLRHKAPLDACLEALLFRRLVRECARASGLRATFLAKPRADGAGSGMHFHASMRDANGGYCFADEKVLHAAVAGVLAVIGEGTAFFAPFGNSYRRFAPNIYAPLSACWGEENRNAAVRLPRAGSPAEKRFEFRAAGADANPYLAAAALLAGAHWGMSRGLRPPPPMRRGTRIPPTWHAALEGMRRAKILPRYISPQFLRLYLEVKASELHRENAHITDYDREHYGRVL